MGLLIISNSKSQKVRFTNQNLKEINTKDCALITNLFVVNDCTCFVAMAMFGNKYEETPDVIGKSVKEAEQIFNKTT